MHRIHFTAEDVARIRVLPTLGPLAETLHSLFTLRQRSDGLLFGGWRQQTQAAMQPRFGVLGSLAPGRKPCLDLITLTGPGRDLEESGEVLLARSRRDVAWELDYFAGVHGRLPPSLRPLADDLGARRELLSTVRSYHQVAIGPRWTRIHAHLEAERAYRGAALLDGGLEKLLATLHPTITWAAPVLRIDTGARTDVDFHLAGRGLTLAPSFFLRSPDLMIDPTKPDSCLLVYPARLRLENAADVWAGTAPGQALGNLLGRTRAVVLSAIADGTATTGALAERAGTSSAAVSQHTAILRDAGLITTRRHRSTVQHTVTQTGANLLNRPSASTSPGHSRS